MKDQITVLNIDVDNTDLSDSIREQISDATEGLLEKFCEKNNCSIDSVWESLSVEIIYNIHERVIIPVKE